MSHIIFLEFGCREKSILQRSVELYCYEGILIHIKYRFILFLIFINCALHASTPLIDQKTDSAMAWRESPDSFNAIFQPATPYIQVTEVGAIHGSKGITIHSGAMTTSRCKLNFLKDFYFRFYFRLDSLNYDTAPAPENTPTQILSFNFSKKFYPEQPSQFMRIRILFLKKEENPLLSFKIDYSNMAKREICLPVAVDSVYCAEGRFRSFWPGQHCGCFVD